MRKSLNIMTLAVLVLSLTSAAFADEAPAMASGVVNINTAGVDQLSYLPRVGKAAAQRIVDYRTEHGPFQKATDLMQVKGFGAKTFERISSYIAIDGKSTLTAKVSSPRKPRAKSQKPTNTASN